MVARFFGSLFPNLYILTIVYIKAPISNFLCEPLWFKRKQLFWTSFHFLDFYTWRTDHEILDGIHMWYVRYAVSVVRCWKASLTDQHYHTTAPSSSVQPHNTWKAGDDHVQTLSWDCITLRSKEIVKAVVTDFNPVCCLLLTASVQRRLALVLCRRLYMRARRYYTKHAW